MDSKITVRLVIRKFVFLVALCILLTSLLGGFRQIEVAAQSLSGSWSSTGDLLLSRYSFRATQLQNGKVLIEGGFAPGSYTTESELFDPATRTWLATGSMNGGRGEHTATVLLDGRVLVTGGYAGPVLASSEIYAPVSGTWTSTGNMQQVRTRHTATLLPNGKVLVTGGWNGSMISSAELYDPVNGFWSSAGNMMSRRADHSAILLPNNKVLVIAGSQVNGGVTNTVELYDSVTGGWSVTGSLNIPRDLFGATLLPNGKVLVFGGRTASGLTSTAELYDPATATWSFASSMHNARGFPVGHQPILLQDGTVIAAGGDDSATSEIYTPSDDAWSSPVSMGQQRWGSVTALLADGRVLIAGGADLVSPDNKLVSSQIYEPSTSVTGIDYHIRDDFHVFKIDTQSPNLRFEMVMANDVTSVNYGKPTSSPREYVRDMVARVPYVSNNPVLAINADYFGDNANGTGNHGPEGLTIKNLSRFDGQYAFPPEVDTDGNEFLRSSLSISSSNTVRIGRLAACNTLKKCFIWMPTSDYYNTTGGGPLFIDLGKRITDKKNTANSIQPCKNEALNYAYCNTPIKWTAVGTTQDKRYLIIVVSEVPKYMDQTAAVLIAEGAWKAIKLDGGASTQVWYKFANPQSIIGGGRPVANALVVFSSP